MTDLGQYLLICLPPGAGVKTVAFLSGKGGTGKTTITVSVARALAMRGYKVGVLDADSTGANAHKLLPVEEPYSTFDVRGEPPTIKPAVAKFKDAEPIQFVGMALVSESYVHWSGESHGEFVSQIVQRTHWGDLDYLLIDSPPGTHSDATQAINWSDVVVIVTIPGKLANLDAQRTLNLVSSMGKPVAGVFVNFDLAICPKCGERFRLFEGRDDLGVPLIQRVPWTQSEWPDIDVESLLQHLQDPVWLERRKKSRVKRTIFEAVIRRIGRKAIQEQEAARAKGGG